MTRRCSAAWVVALWLSQSVASAQEAAPSPALSGYLKAMEQARLLHTQDASAAELRALVAKGEAFYVQGRYAEAAAVLLEALEGPRYADFRDFEEYRAAQFMAATALFHLGSLKSAWRYLEPIIAQGPANPHYGPAVRRLSDVALRLGDPQAAAALLAQGQAGMPEDAKNEWQYLQGRVHYEAGATAEAAAAFTRITKQSRFYANAQYQLGAIASQQKQWKTAEQRFCSVADTGVEDRYSFFVDARFFEVQDLARLGLGRVAHERGRGDDAFYYYFQVPQDSPRLPEAMFEAAYATYESEGYDASADLLDQLEARFPKSPFVDEAAVLRGYTALGRCDFQRADRQFTRFVKRYTPLVQEIDRLLENPLRRRMLFEALRDPKAGAPPSEPQERLLALLRVDPSFYALHRSVDELDAETARSGRLSDALLAFSDRLAGRKKPKALAQDTLVESEVLQRDLENAVALARALGQELDALRAAGAKTADIAETEKTLNRLAERLDALEARADELRAQPRDVGAGDADALPALLTSDSSFVDALPSRAAQVRTALLAAADARAEQGLRELRVRLDGLVRRARIGRIDAVMGSKRRIERQIESLAAGRLPLEYRDSLRTQGLLADDEEYWPHEGEDWPDEYEERYGDAEEDAPAAEGNEP